MDMSDQARDAFRRWNDAQREAWDRWLAALGQQRPAMPAPVLRQSVEFGEAMIELALEMQLDAARGWARMMESGGDRNPALAAAARSLAETAETYTSARREAWHAFFEAMKEAAPQGDAPSSSAPMLDAWRESTERMLEAQQRWMHGWLEAGGGAGKPARSKAPAKRGEPDAG